MKTRLISLLMFVALTSFAQTGSIKGRVIDAKTFKPLAFATVYMNQTTIGSVTNEQGDFNMKNIPAGTFDLVVSYLGYQPYQSRVIINDSIPVTMSIKMIPSTTNLGQVLVKGKKDDQWNLLYDKFKKQFFGVSPYTSECKILNPWVLELTEDSKGILIASASLPVEIENLGLGYTITCTLKEFQAGASIYKISGTYRFTEAATADQTLSELWHTRREDVYRGSPRHLFRSVVEHRTVEEGFDLYTDISKNPEVIRNSSFLTNVNVSLKPLPPNEILEGGKRNGEFVIKLPARMEVHYLGRSAQAKIYRNIPHPISWIEVSGGSVDVNASGIITNPNRMTILGAMSEARIAEVLPMDYQPAAYAKGSDAQREKAYSSLAALLEKPYVMTDKPYYYASDAILFKAFFNYISPVYRDSLSHVMRVELIDSNQKIIRSKLFPIMAGSSFGDISLPSTVKPGDYTLRTYTRWMLNFDDQLIFSKPVKVLGSDQLAKPTDVKQESKQLAIRTEKDEFGTREKITIALEASNFYGNQVAADLAVSVTDVSQASIPSDPNNILSQFAFRKETLPDSSLKNPQYLIQYGIDFSGQMVSGKKNTKTGGVLTIYQENVTDVFAITTDGEGKFHQQLQVMDSVDLLVAAKTLKGRGAKIVMDEIKEPAPPVTLATPIQLDVYRPANPSDYHKTDTYSTAKMLQAVTIEAKRIERTTADKKYLLTDSHLEGDFLRSTNATDLLTALQGRVPGLLVRYVKDWESGNVKKLVGFSAVVSRAFVECAAELDGMMITPIGGETLAERLASMTVNEVESVDVLRFASASAYGVRAANGVIVIKTRMGNKPADETPRPDRSKLQVVSLSGYSEAAEFTSPDYSEHTTGDDRADYRSTIYWNPHAIADGKEPLMLSFYAADIPTSYRIVVEGVTTEGEPVRGEKIIVVTGKK
jgi:TonB-dependent SusC/RagA subfamily outer membrane receptor